MKVCRVIGRVVLSQSIFEKPGSRFLIVSPMGKDELAAPDETRVSEQTNFITYDNLGAHSGDCIGVVEGGEATRPFDHDMPIDAYNACIFDSVTLKVQ